MSGELETDEEDEMHSIESVEDSETELEEKKKYVSKKPLAENVTDDFAEELNDEKHLRSFAEAKEEYARENLDLDIDPWSHYVMYGRKSGLIWPGKKGFEAKTFQAAAKDYLRRYPQVEKNDFEPWSHYLKYGKDLGYIWLGPPHDVDQEIKLDRKKSSASKSHAQSAKDDVGEELDDQKHLRSFEEAKEEYAKENFDLDCDPWSHYVMYGRKIGLRWPGQKGFQAKTFQAAAKDYLRRYPRLKKNDTEPWSHYLWYGKDYGYIWLGPPHDIDPETFEEASQSYLARHPDLTLKAKSDPWAHYVLFGKKQNRTWLGVDRKIPQTFEAAKQDYLDRYKNRTLKDKEDSWIDYLADGRGNGRYWIGPAGYEPKTHAEAEKFYADRLDLSLLLRLD